LFLIGLYMRLFLSFISCILLLAALPEAFAADADKPQKRGVSAALEESEVYGAHDLLRDCQSAESLLAGGKGEDFLFVLQGARCVSYIQGMLEGYDLAENLARRVGAEVSVFCPPRAEGARLRWARAVLAYFDHQPPLPKESAQFIPASRVLAAALSRFFPCESIRDGTAE
jgi:hypothetical protein